MGRLSQLQYVIYIPFFNLYETSKLVPMPFAIALTIHIKMSSKLFNAGSLENGQVLP